MVWLALGAAALALLLMFSRGRPILQRPGLRVAAAALALAAFVGAFMVGARAGFGSAALLIVLGLWLLVSARRSGLGPGETGSRTERPAPGRMSEADARAILGVGPDATREEIQAAYSRLIRMAHPDKGGTSGLAAQLNAARDRLLRG